MEKSDSPMKSQVRRVTGIGSSPTRPTAAPRAKPLSTWGNVRTGATATVRRPPFSRSDQDPGDAQGTRRGHVGDTDIQGPPGRTEARGRLPSPLGELGERAAPHRQPARSQYSNCSNCSKSSPRASGACRPFRSSRRRTCRPRLAQWPRVHLGTAAPGTPKRRGRPEPRGSPRGDRPERGRAGPLRRQLCPGERCGVGVVDGAAAHGVRGEPHGLPERAVVDPARHGRAARLAGQVGGVGPVEPAAVAAAFLRDQPGAACISGRDDDRAGRAVGQGVDRRTACRPPPESRGAGVAPAWSASLPAAPPPAGSGPPERYVSFA